MKSNSLQDKKFLVTGGDGFLGTAVVQGLLAKGVLKKNIVIPKFPEDDLLIYENCERLMTGGDVVIHLAAKVGGILYNQKHPGSMIHDNLKMGLNIMESARRNNIQKVVNIGTTCAYPENISLPYKEEDLWNGYPAEVTAPYGLAKKMLLELGKGYNKEYGLNSIFLLPVNLYGPRDHFEGENTHVIPALVSRFVKAKNNNEKEITIWGSGIATREFLYIEDAAEGILKAIEHYNSPEPVNLGTGIETPIGEIVKLIANTVGFKGNIIWDKTKPDGVLRRVVDISKSFNYFGFKAETKIENGIWATVQYYKNLRGTL